MRETPGSLRVYFILVGCLTVGPAALDIANFGSIVWLMALNALSIALGVGMLVGGAMVPRLLRTMPAVLHAIVWCTFCWRLVLVAILHVATGPLAMRTYLSLVVALAIAAYLSFNIKRLSQDEGGAHGQ